ncbi:MAG: branched-chain amino acid ABC transporter permease [Gammaproteobacteria bacterium]|nr:branched-chain amino acid ABC transporter permease [Gammaproteobacteria bacterium]
MNFVKQQLLNISLLLIFALMPLVAFLLNEPFYLTLLSRVMIYAIAAISLDLILGYGGMVSLGHAVFVGFGAYSIGILAQHGIHNGYLAFAIAILGSALLALLTGILSLRTRGIYFIMITLAFAQMLYYITTNLSQYGGEDGMSLISRSDFGSLLPLHNDTVFFYFVWLILAIILIVGKRLVNSHFGMVLRGSHSNLRRMHALGFNPFIYQLSAYVIAGSLAGLAGALLANQAQYVSPSYLHWTQSGHLIVMVVLGGLATLTGPLIGTTLFLLAEEFLSRWTEHWMIILGPALLIIVLLGRGGVLGLSQNILQKIKSYRSRGNKTS